eukprot:gene15861-biopygen3272
MDIPECQKKYTNTVTPGTPQSNCAKWDTCGNGPALAHPGEAQAIPTGTCMAPAAGESILLLLRVRRGAEEGATRNEPSRREGSTITPAGRLSACMTDESPASQSWTSACFAFGPRDPQPSPRTSAHAGQAPVAEAARAGAPAAAALPRPEPAAQRLVAAPVVPPVRFGDELPPADGAECSIAVSAVS